MSQKKPSPVPPWTNWFAEGWLEVGAGITREVRLILKHPAESAVAITLTLNAPLRFNGGDAKVTLLL